MVEAKRARTAETPKLPSYDLRSRASYFYPTTSEIALEIVQQREAEGHFPQSAYAFDNGLLHVPLTRYIEQRGKHWVSNLESSRHIQWQGQWSRVDEVAAERRREHPESFRRVRVRGRNGETRVHWVWVPKTRMS